MDLKYALKRAAWTVFLIFWGGGIAIFFINAATQLDSRIEPIHRFMFGFLGLVLLIAYLSLLRAYLESTNKRIKDVSKQLVGKKLK